MAKRSLSLSRTLLFAVVVVAVALTVVELTARWLESTHQAGDAVVGQPESSLVKAKAPPSSPLAFQQFSGRPLLENGPAFAQVQGLEMPASDPDLGPFPDLWTGHTILSHEWIDLRGQRVLDEKSADELRIVFLGGSALGGWGLPASATAVGIVERLLRKAAPDKKIRVLNLSRTGFGSAQLTWAFEQVAARLQPDLVVTVMGNNERLDVAAAVYARQDDEAEVDRLTRTLPAGGELAAVGTSIEHPFLRSLSARSAVVRLLRAVDPGVVSGSGLIAELPGVISGDDQVMPSRDKLKHEDKINRFALERLNGTLASLQETARSVDAQLLVSTVPVNLRYNSSEHEWFFIGPGLFRDEAYRTAHWAYYFEAPEHGAEAMRLRLREHPEELPAHLLLGIFLQRQGRMEEAETHLARVIADLDVDASRADQGSGMEWTSETQLLYAWALRVLFGSEEALEKVGPWIESWRSERHRQMGTDTCPVANLFFYAGDMESARIEHERCLLDAYYYRADPPINERLLSRAGELGAESFDLATAVISHSPSELPGYETFLDYCHYNPRGNVLIGHLLATRIREVLSLPGKVESAERALLRFQEQRSSRLIDLPGLDDWVGVNFDVTFLTSDRHGDASHSVREGDPESALGKVFAANERASGRYRCFGQCECHCSPRFGLREHHEELPSTVVEAAQLYRDASAQEPALDAARDNLVILRDRLLY
jgi:hypothetical protein